MRFHLLPALALGVILASCATPVSTESAASRETGRDPGQAKVPVLRSSYLEKNWGPPDVTTFADGGYRLRFRQGMSLNYVFIHGLMNPAPVPASPPDWSEESFNDATGFPKLIPHKQQWRDTSILGAPVKWYQKDSGGGADFPCYKTVDFMLNSPDGRSGHYRIEVCATTDRKAAD